MAAQAWAIGANYGRIRDGTRSDKGRRKKKKRIFIVRRKATPETNADPAWPACELRSHEPFAQRQLHQQPKSGTFITRKDRAEELSMALLMKAGEIESVGPTSPVNNEKAGPKRDPRTGRVLERSILGSAADFERRMLTSLHCGVECPSAYPILRSLDAPASGYRQEVVAERLRISQNSHRSASRCA